VPSIASRNPRLTATLLELGGAVARICLTIAAVALLAIVAINGANVVARYCFAAPFSWAEESMIYLMITGVFSGGVAIAWQQRHIRIDAFLALAPARLRHALEILAAVISAGVLLVLAFAGYRMTSTLLQFDQRSDALRLPMWIPHGALLLGIGLIVAMTLLRLFAPRDDDGAPPRDIGAMD
jgi:TRAP-type C4-dicarboxylate transport system permease small subunit